jgi:hypothetical protein
MAAKRGFCLNCGLMMKYLPTLISLLALASCTPKEEEAQPDYDNMVMAGQEEEEEWTPGQDKDEKAIADVGAQEFLIEDPEKKTEGEPR